MDDFTCACGYEAVTAVELGDHIGEMTIPPDDIAPDGQVHAEAAGGKRGTGASQNESWCLCGFTSDAAAGLDEHLLAVFTGSGATGQDGREHGPS
jgi:hypothetical protein